MEAVLEKVPRLAKYESALTKRPIQRDEPVEVIGTAALPREVLHQETADWPRLETHAETFPVVSRFSKRDRKGASSEPSEVEKDVDDLDDNEVEAALNKNGHGLSRWRKRLLWSGRGIIGVGVVVGLLTPPPIILIPIVVPIGLVLIVAAVGPKKAWHDVKLTIHKTKLGVKNALVSTAQFFFGAERAAKVDAWCKRVMFSKKKKKQKEKGT